MTAEKTVALIYLIAIGAAGLASSARAEGIDCNKAQTPVDKAICGDPALQALDKRVATAYGRLLKELDADSAKALRNDQKWFLTTRDNGTGVSKGVVDKADLADSLQYRAKFLEAIVPHPGPGLAGHWQNVAGDVTLKATPDNRLTFEGNAADPQSARWVCDAAGDGPLASNEAKIAVTTDDGLGPSPRRERARPLPSMKRRHPRMPEVRPTAASTAASRASISRQASDASPPLSSPHLRMTQESITMKQLKAISNGRTIATGLATLVSTLLMGCSVASSAEQTTAKLTTALRHIPQSALMTEDPMPIVFMDIGALSKEAGGPLSDAALRRMTLAKFIRPLGALAADGGKTWTVKAGIPFDQISYFAAFGPADARIAYWGLPSAKDATHLLDVLKANKFKEVSKSPVILANGEPRAINLAQRAADNPWSGSMGQTSAVMALDDAVAQASAPEELIKLAALKTSLADDEAIATALHGLDTVGNETHGRIVQAAVVTPLIGVTTIDPAVLVDPERTRHNRPKRSGNRLSKASSVFPPIRLALSPIRVVTAVQRLRSRSSLRQL